MRLRARALGLYAADLPVEAGCSEMVNRAAYEAIQVHGGAGCLRESGIERIYRQSRVLTIVEGTSEIQRLSIARSLLKERWSAVAA
ncbi:MAG: acyl-CoA dehydrogenase family protein [Myxococcales bacterium]|nr:acyl-CoA dehydrogenase family protein [Myxococcales bacterium]